MLKCRPMLGATAVLANEGACHIGSGARGTRCWQAASAWRASPDPALKTTALQGHSLALSDMQSSNSTQTLRIYPKQKLQHSTQAQWA